MAPNRDDGSILRGTRETPSSISSWATKSRSRLTSEVDTKKADLVLLGCYFITGMVDSIAFNTWRCFVGMQTGNTIFAGLGVSDLPGDVPRFTWTKSIIAIVSFGCGSLFFSRYHRRYGSLRRWVIMSSFLIQVAFMALTTSLISAGEITQSTGSVTASVRRGFPWHDLCPIALLAFQSAGQVVASRVLKYNAMPTVVLTTLICDMMSEPRLFTTCVNPDRDKKVVALLLMFAGATVAGALIKTSVGYSGALWVATGVKGAMVVVWLIWTPQKETGQR